MASGQAQGRSIFVAGGPKTPKSAEPPTQYLAASRPARFKNIQTRSALAERVCEFEKVKGARSHITCVEASRPVENVFAQYAASALICGSSSGPPELRLKAGIMEPTRPCSIQCFQKSRSVSCLRVRRSVTNSARCGES